METPYLVELLQEKDFTAYSNFLKNCPDALYEHSLAVRELISKHFKFEPFYLIAKEEKEKKEEKKEKEEGTVVGALPLFKAKSWLEGTRYVSLPFFPFGGVIGKNNDVKRALLEEAKKLSCNAKFLEIRQRHTFEEAEDTKETEETTEDTPASDFVKQSPITNFLIDLKNSEEEMLASLPKDVRYDIRKAQKNNLKVVIVDPESLSARKTPLVRLSRNQQNRNVLLDDCISAQKKQLDDFYSVYLNTRKKRGVPAWPYGLFADALKNCRTAVAVAYLEQENGGKNCRRLKENLELSCNSKKLLRPKLQKSQKPVAAAFLFFEKEMIEYAFAGTDYRYNRISPYYLLLWEILRYGIAHKYKVLDLGGSTKEMNDGNMHAFKKKWATRTQEVPYYFYAADKKNIPSLQKAFGLYRLYGQLWSLLPKTVIKWISPRIIRQFK